MNVIKKLFPYFKKYATLLVSAIISNILLAFFTVFSIPLIIPFFQILFERTPPSPVKPENIWNMPGQLDYFFSNLIISLEKQQALFYVCLFIIVVFLLKNVFRYLALFFLAPARNGIIRDIRNEIMEKYLELPLSFYADRKRGDLISRISNDVQEIEVSILNVVEAIFKAPLIIIGSLFFMIYISPTLTFFVLILLLVTSFIIGGISKTLKKQSHEAQDKLGQIMTITEESIAGIRIIKSFLGENAIIKKFDAANTSYKNTLTRILWRRDLSSPLSEFLGITVVTILLYYGASQVFDNKLAPETFFAFIFAFYQVIEPSKMFAAAYYNIQKGAAAYERIEGVLELQNEIKNNSGTILKYHFEKEIKISGLYFSFPSSEIPVLSDINLVIPKGKRIALVGASGAGKTTLVNLLPRFYDIKEGTMTIDNIPVKDLSLTSLRHLFGFVSQEPVLFHDTIRNNIAFGITDAMEKDIIQAAKIANAHEFISAQENGYDTIVGDKGAKLSGGQRQRLTIARALLKNPAILILDEATSALDAESELLVKEALEKAMANRTVITIAHKFSTILSADEIIVMKEGRILQRGKHEDLIKQEGEYYNNMILQQF